MQATQVLALYLLYWYKSDAKVMLALLVQKDASDAGTHFTCFTGTKSTNTDRLSGAGQKARAALSY